MRYRNRSRVSDISTGSGSDADEREGMPLLGAIMRSVACRMSCVVSYEQEHERGVLDCRVSWRIFGGRGCFVSGYRSVLCVAL